MSDFYDGWGGYDILLNQDQISAETVQEAITQAIRMALKKECKQ